MVGQSRYLSTATGLEIMCCMIMMLCVTLYLNGYKVSPTVLVLVNLLANMMNRWNQK